MSEPQRIKPVINLDEVQIGDRPQMFQPTGKAAERFSCRMGVVGTRIGARMLGYNITAVPSGKRAFPLHNHHANEEMFFILAGSGELRVGDERYSLRAGDFIASPPGGPESAHQIVNTGNEELRYLAVSTMLTPETVDTRIRRRSRCCHASACPMGPLAWCGTSAATARAPTTGKASSAR